MRHEDDFIEDWRTVRVDNSRPPLRWIANFLGSRASSAMMRLFDAEENGTENTFAYKRDLFIWDKCWPIYEKWGTFYNLKIGEED
jgi:hypothetical protein